MGDTGTEGVDDFDKMLASMGNTPESGLSEVPSETGEASDSHTPGQTEGAEPRREESRQTAEEMYEIGGRKYTLDGLKKTAAEQHKTLSRLQAENADFKKWAPQWKQMEEIRKSDPDHYRWLQRANEEYLKRKQSGQSDSAARRDSGLQGVPKDILEKLERHDQLLEKQVLSEEENYLRSKYGSGDKAQDDSMIDGIFKTMLEIVEESYDPKTGVSLQPSPDLAFKLWKANQNGVDAKIAKEKLARVKAGSDVGGSSHASVQSPEKRPGSDNWTEQDFDKEMNRFVREKL